MRNYKIMNYEERIRKAESLFMQGFNCCQSVVAAFADIYGYSEQQSLTLSAGFGAGIGRMRLTCGACCALAQLAGMDCGSSTPGDREGKSYNYKVVQQLFEKFHQEHGSTTCSELLKLKKGAPLSFEASERTAEYYRTRPCVNQIITAARIYADYLREKEMNSDDKQP